MKNGPVLNTTIAWIIFPPLMRLVTYALNSKSPPRVGILRDESAEGPILDLERSARVLGVRGLAARASLKQLLALGDGVLGRLSKAARKLWSDIERSPKRAGRLLVDGSKVRYLPPIPDP